VLTACEYAYIYIYIYQISYDPVGDHYAIRDVGSVGGTFIRIPFGKKKELVSGEQVTYDSDQHCNT
jgi:hypothetical protein